MKGSDESTVVPGEVLERGALCSFLGRAPRRQQNPSYVVAPGAGALCWLPQCTLEELAGLRERAAA